MKYSKHHVASTLRKAALVLSQFSDVPHKKRDWVRMTVQDMRKDPSLARELFDLVKEAYKGIGGHAGVRTPKDLTNGDIAFFDIVDIDSDGNADAVSLIKKKPAGEKYIGMGHDGSRDAKDTLIKRRAKTLKSKGVFVEVSGAIAHILLTRYGVPPVNDESTVRKALGKDIEWVGAHPDGKYPGVTGWYIRQLGDGDKHMKIMLGHPKA